MTFRSMSLGLCEGKLGQERYKAMAKYIKVTADLEDLALKYILISLA